MAHLWKRGTVPQETVVTIPWLDELIIVARWPVHWTSGETSYSFDASLKNRSVGMFESAEDAVDGLILVLLHEVWDWRKDASPRV